MGHQDLCVIVFFLLPPSVFPSGVSRVKGWRLRRFLFFCCSIALSATCEEASPNQFRVRLSFHLSLTHPSPPLLLLLCAGETGAIKKDCGMLDHQCDAAASPIEASTCVSYDAQMTAAGELLTFDSEATTAENIAILADPKLLVTEKGFPANGKIKAQQQCGDDMLQHYVESMAGFGRVLASSVTAKTGTDSKPYVEVSNSLKIPLFQGCGTTAMDSTTKVCTYGTPIDLWDSSTTRVPVDSANYKFFEMESDFLLGVGSTTNVALAATRQYTKDGTAYTGCRAPDGNGGCDSATVLGAGALAIAATFSGFPFSTESDKKFDGTTPSSADLDKAVVCLTYEFLFNTLKRNQFHLLRMNVKKTSAAVATNELVFLKAHGFAANTPVTFSLNGAATITGLTDGTTYFVLAGTAATTMKLSLTSGGAAITISGGAAGNSIGLQYFKEWTAQLCPGTEGTATDGFENGVDQDCQAIENVPTDDLQFSNIQIPLGDKLYIYGAGSLFSTDATTSATMKLGAVFSGNAMYLSPCFPSKDVRDTTSKTVFWGRRRRLAEDDTTSLGKIESEELFPLAVDPVARSSVHRRWLAEYCPGGVVVPTTSAAASGSTPIITSILSGLAFAAGLALVL